MICGRPPGRPFVFLRPETRRPPPTAHRPAGRRAGAALERRDAATRQDKVFFLLMQNSAGSENSGQGFFLASGICVPLRTRDCINPGAEVLKTEFCRSAGDFAPCLLARDGEIAGAFFFKP